MGLEITIHINGKQYVEPVKLVDSDDELFFMEKRIKLSCEELSNGRRVLYGDWGRKLDDGTPDESMVIVGADTKFNAAAKLLRANIEMEMKLR